MCSNIIVLAPDTELSISEWQENDYLKDIESAKLPVH